MLRETPTDPPRSARGATLQLLVIALSCAALAFWIRTRTAVGIQLGPTGTAIQDGGEPTWGSYDPDTLYHARRVERGVRRGGWIDSYDPLLAFGEEGLTPIPWPPFYDLALTAAYRRALPDFDVLMDPEGHPAAGPLSPGERGSIERFVASAPRLFGALTAFLAALMGAGLARQALRARGFQRTGALSAAAFAGVTMALSFGHLRYSHLGNGDHHAFVSLLHLAMLGLTGRALAHERIVQPFWSALRGAGAGACAAMLLTTWTASILWIALIQLALLIRLLVPIRAEDGRRFSARGLPIFATSFHKAALLGAVPAVIESPFSDLTPWSLVDLSWFHLAWLSVGWLVFAPYALMPQTAVKNRLVALGPAALVALAVAFGTPAVGSLREALSWAGATNPFMSSINESRGLMDTEGGSFLRVLKFCGAGVVFAPLVLLLGLRLVRRQPDLLPLLLTLPVVLAAALLQRRFAESLAGPLAVFLGLGYGLALAALCRRLQILRLGRLGVLGLTVGSAAFAAALHPWTIRNAHRYGEIQAAAGQLFSNTSPFAARQAAFAKFLEGLDVGDPGAGPDGVLAHWDLGHAIEWRAGLATVATNFGLYVGEDAFLDPWRFFTETDEAAALKILRDRGVRWVLMEGDRNRVQMGAALDLPVGEPSFWRRTMAARLMGDGAGQAPLPVPRFLRLYRTSRAAGAQFSLYELAER